MLVIVPRPVPGSGKRNPGYKVAVSVSSACGREVSFFEVGLKEWEKLSFKIIYSYKTGTYPDCSWRCLGADCGWLPSQLDWSTIQVPFQIPLATVTNLKK